MRREAQEARLKEFQETVDRAMAGLEGLRNEASGRVPELARQVLALFTPKPGGAQSQR